MRIQRHHIVNSRQFAYEKLSLWIKQQCPHLEGQPISMISHKFFLWSDSSLDCAVPGRHYRVILTPGQKYEFKIGNNIFHVHVNINCTACEMPLPDTSQVVNLRKVQKITPTITCQEFATQKLSLWLQKQHPNLMKDPLSLKSSSTHLWPSSALGCKEPGICYTGRLTQGHRYEFQIGDHQFFVHVNKEQTLCVMPLSEPPQVVNLLEDPMAKASTKRAPDEEGSRKRPREID